MILEESCMVVFEWFTFQYIRALFGLVLCHDPLKTRVHDLPFCHIDKALGNDAQLIQVAAHRSAEVTQEWFKNEGNGLWGWQSRWLRISFEPNLHVSSPFFGGGIQWGQGVRWWFQGFLRNVPKAREDDLIWNLTNTFFEMDGSKRHQLEGVV